VDDHTEFVLKVSYGSERTWEVYKRYRCGKLPFPVGL
jgi:hypothetical protein